MIGPFKMCRLLRAIVAGQPLLPWADPPDFTGRERTRLFAAELDVLRENLLDLDSRLGGLFPAGVMWAWAGDPAAVPAGWLWCNGASLSTGVYPALHAAIGYSYGGSGTAFNLPDARGRVLVGSGTGPGLTARVRGIQLGAEVVALTLAETPVHAHTINEHTHAGTTGDHDRQHLHGSSSAGNHFHNAGIGSQNRGWSLNTVHTHDGGGMAKPPSGGGMDAPGDNYAIPVNVDAVGDHNHGNSGNANTGHLHPFTSGGASNRGTDSQGSGQGHNNMQPGVVVGGAIIKT